MEVYLNTYLQHVWVHPYKTAETAKTTIKFLGIIFNNFTPSKCFMTDRGSHFNNKVVKEHCKE